SGYPVSDSLLDPAAEAAMGHIELGKWADLVILAPATAPASRNASRKCSIVPAPPEAISGTRQTSRTFFNCVRS
ncbi:bifunctional phosphopantothenoylcysteine decarboxylase/phosphopantothenate synthase, partial [Salmonella enterica subsp. enterica serovar Heidelberg str. 640151-11]